MHSLSDKSHGQAIQPKAPMRPLNSRPKRAANCKENDRQQSQAAHD